MIIDKKLFLLAFLTIILFIFKNKEHFLINEKKWLNYRLGIV